MGLAWKRLQPTVVSKVGHRTIVSKLFEQPDGAARHYETVGAEGVHFVGVIALSPENKVIVARQFRSGPEKIMDEVPGGMVDPDDRNDYRVAALRELAEETGYTSDQVTDLGTVYKDCSHNGIWHYYLAENCQPSGNGQQLDESEFIEAQLISIAEFMQNARNGRMTDVDAVFLAYDTLKALAQEG